MLPMSTAPFGPGGGSLLPGPPPATAGGATGLNRQGLIEHAGQMSPLALMTWSKMGRKPSHASSIFARLQQSGCCPGARTAMGPASDPNSLASGERTVRCNNGNVYSLDNWQGGIRARRVVGGGRAECDRIHDGTFMVVQRGAGAQGLGRATVQPGMTVCPMHIAPVTVDGVTYNNRCEAERDAPAGAFKREEERKSDRAEVGGFFDSLRRDLTDPRTWIKGLLFFGAATGVAYVVRPRLPASKREGGVPFLIGVIVVGGVSKLMRGKLLGVEI